MENQTPVQVEQSEVAPPTAQTVITPVAINGKATTSLVLGILGLVAWIIPLFGLPITIIGLVVGNKGLATSKRRRAIVGIVLCCIGLLATVVNGAIGAYLGATGQNPLVNKILNNQNITTKNTAGMVSDTDSSVATYDGMKFVLGFTDKTKLDFFEYNLPGEFGDDWTKIMIKIAYQKDGVSTVDMNKDTAMQLASNVIALVEENGGTVLDKNMYKVDEAALGTPETYILIYALGDGDIDVEINMQKFYVEEGVAKMVGYSEKIPRIEGEKDESLEGRVENRRAELFASEHDFVATKYEFPG